MAPTGCPCSPEFDNAFRATVWGLGDGEIRLRVIDFFDGPLNLQFDDEVVADWDGQLPCGNGCADIALNTQVFAFYEPRPPRLPDCVARERCELLCACGSDCPDASAMALGALESQVSPACRDQCLDETRDACPPLPEFDERVGVARVAVWNVDLIFAETTNATLTVPRDDVRELWGDFAACQERFGDATRLGGDPAPLCAVAGE